MKKGEKLLKIVMIVSIIVAIISLIAVLYITVFPSTFYVNTNNILTTNQLVL